MKEDNITVTGNTVIDALYWVIEKMNADQSLDETITKKLIEFGLPAKKLQSWRSCNSSQFVQSNQINSTETPISTEPRKLVLITGHRRENFGQGFLNICEAIKELAETFPDVDFVYPMHLNPNVRGAITEVFGDIQSFRDNSSLIREISDSNEIRVIRMHGTCIL